MSVAKPGAVPTVEEAQVIKVPPKHRATCAYRLRQASDMIASWYSQRNGSRILAFRSTDIDATVRRLDAMRIGHSGASSVDRKVMTTDGPKLVPTKFLEITATEGDHSARGRVAMAENSDAKILHAQKTASHPNGALTLSEAFLYADDKAFHYIGRHYAAYIGSSPQPIENGVCFVVGDGKLTVLNGKGLSALTGEAMAPTSPMFVGYAATVMDLALT